MAACAQLRGPDGEVSLSCGGRTLVLAGRRRRRCRLVDKPLANQPLTDKPRIERQAEESRVFPCKTTASPVKSPHVDPPQLRAPAPRPAARTTPPRPQKRQPRRTTPPRPQKRQPRHAIRLRGHRNSRCTHCACQATETAAAARTAPPRPRKRQPRRATPPSRGCIGLTLTNSLRGSTAHDL